MLFLWSLETPTRGRSPGKVEAAELRRNLHHFEVCLDLLLEGGSIHHTIMMHHSELKSNLPHSTLLQTIQTVFQSLSNISVRCANETCLILKIALY